MAHRSDDLVARRTRRRRWRRVRRGLLAVALAAAALAGVGLGLAAFERFDGETAGAADEAPATEPATTSAPAPAAPAPAPAVPEEEELASVTIAAVGDIAMGRAPVLPPDGGASLFGGVRGELEGDVVLGNLEQALTDSARTSKCPRKAKPSTCFAFRTPPAYAPLLREAGFTVLTLANNHSSDFGAAGLRDTVAALDRARLRHTGLPGEIARVRRNGVRVAVLGFAPYPTAQNMLDLEAAKRLVRRAGRRADVVVVTMHAGGEGPGSARTPRGPERYLGEQRGDSRAFAHAVVDAGADLVVGHGPHRLRGMEFYRGRLVAYSLGNFAGYRTFNTTADGGISGVLRVALNADGTWAGGELAALRLDSTGTPAPDPAGEAYALVRQLSREDFGRRAARISRTGELSPRSG